MTGDAHAVVLRSNDDGFTWEDTKCQFKWLKITSAGSRVYGVIYSTFQVVYSDDYGDTWHERPYIINEPILMSLEWAHGCSVHYDTKHQRLLISSEGMLYELLDGQDTMTCLLAPPSDENYSHYDDGTPNFISRAKPQLVFPRRRRCSRRCYFATSQESL